MAGRPACRPLRAGAVVSQVVTTTGPADADRFGFVLPHEHVLINELREDRADGLLNDVGIMEDELRRVAGLGASLLVELTTGELTVGAASDPRGLYRHRQVGDSTATPTRTASNATELAALAEGSGVGMILGTGHYRDPYLTGPDIDGLGVVGLAERMIADLTEGFDGTRIRAGVIGEVGADKWYVSAREERSIRAAARAHMATGATISTHTSKWPVGGDVLALLRAEGVAPDRVIIGHCSTIDISEYHMAMAEAGAYVQFDTLRGGPGFVMDRAVRHIMALVSAGYLERILLSHDVCLRSHLAMFGGCGYRYIHDSFLPQLRAAGLNDGELDALVRANPLRALAAY